MNDRVHSLSDRRSKEVARQPRPSFTLPNPNPQCFSLFAGASLQRVEVGTLERAVKLSNKDAKLTKEHLRPLQVRDGRKQEGTGSVGGVVGLGIGRLVRSIDRSPLTHATPHIWNPPQLLFRRAELTVLGVSKELDHVRQREAALRETSGAFIHRCVLCSVGKRTKDS